MIIYVNKLKCDSQGHMLFQLAPSIDHLDYRGESLSFSSPVVITGSVEQNEDYYMVTGKIKTEVILECSRCLSSVRYPIKTGFKQKYSEVAEEEETLPANGDKIDLGKPVIESILLELPIKVLCKEECKGLCPECGLDRNDVECNCTHDQIDPRMLELKKLLEE